MTQAKDDLDLNSLVDFLTTRGTKASTATIERLTKASAAIASAVIATLKNDSATVDAMFKTQKITDADRRDMLYFRQAGILATTVEELKTWLGLLDHLYHPTTLDHRLRVLFEFAASIAVLARRCIDDELADQLLDREHTARAWGGRSANSRLAETFTLAVGKQFRLGDPNKSARGIAGPTHKQVNKRLRARGKPQVRWSTVYSYLRKNWARIAPPPK